MQKRSVSLAGSGELAPRGRRRRVMWWKCNGQNYKPIWLFYKGNFRTFFSPIDSFDEIVKGFFKYCHVDVPHEKRKLPTHNFTIQTMATVPTPFASRTGLSFVLASLLSYHSSCAFQSVASLVARRPITAVSSSGKKLLVDALFLRHKSSHNIVIYSSR